MCVSVCLSSRVSSGMFVCLFVCHALCVVLSVHAAFALAQLTLICRPLPTQRPMLSPSLSLSSSFLLSLSVNGCVWLWCGVIGGLGWGKGERKKKLNLIKSSCACVRGALPPKV